eukprot:25745-Rhodomonas_salina.2
MLLDGARCMLPGQADGALEPGATRHWLAASETMIAGVLGDSSLAGAAHSTAPSSNARQTSPVPTACAPLSPTQHWPAPPRRAHSEQGTSAFWRPDTSLPDTEPGAASSGAVVSHRWRGLHARRGRR